MAIGFGDLVPYNHLPGAVAGQEAMQDIQQVPAGELAAANARKAQDEALQSDMNTTLQQQKSPSALILSNLKDAQSINHMPIKATYDDLQAAHEKVMGDSDEKPSPLDQKKIMSLADEMAQARAPKFDPNNPADWLSKQDPTSNSEMTLVKAQAVLDGRMQMGANNLDLRERKFDYQKEQDPIKEAGKNKRAGILAGSGTGVPRGVQKDARGIESEFDKSTVGMMVNSPYADKKLLMDPERGQSARAQIVQYLHNIAALGDDQKTMDFYNKVKKYIPAEPAPPAIAAPKVFKNKPQGSRAPGDDSAMIETTPTQGGLTGTATSTPVPDGATVPNTVKQVVSINGKVYGVGDEIMMGTHKFIVTYGDGKRGGLKRAD